MTGDDVLAARTRLGLSRTKFAELCGLTPTKIHNIEKGREIRPDELEALRPHVTEGEAPQTSPAPAPEPVVVAPEPAPAEAAQEVEQPAPAPPPPVPPGSRVVSNSEVQVFKDCRRKWWLAFHRGLAPKREEVIGPRAIGTRVHLALSAYYSTRGEDPMQVIESTAAEDRARVGDDPDTAKKLESEIELARIMVEGYLDWVQETGADAGLEIIADEQNVFVPAGIDNVYLAGKLDVRIRREVDGVHLFMDHKTVGDLTTPTRTLHMDEQMLMYHLLEQLGTLGYEGERTDGGLYNMLRKVKRTAQAKPPFYDRVEVRHNVHELRSFYLRVHGVIRELLAVERQLAEGVDPRYVCYPRPSRDCTWKCDYFLVCPMFDDGSAAEDLLSEYYVSYDPYSRYGVDDKTEEA